MPTLRTSLPGLGAQAHAHSTGLSLRERADLLRRAAGAGDGLAVGTIWMHGKRDTYDGTRFTESWVSFANVLTEYADQVVAKGEGAWFTPAVSANGRCRDIDVEWITFLGLDADGVGDWDDLRDLLRTAGIAALFQCSSSHRKEQPKFHVYLPTTEWWRGDKSEWRRIYRHCVGWFSGAAQLRFDLSVPLYGFDHATDRLGQPWFFSARRSADQEAPHVLYQDGLALDLEKFLELTGFDPTPPASGSRARRVTRARASAPSQDGPRSLLERAFMEAGWYGSISSNGRCRVLCPWRNLHTSGVDFDGGTVIFAPSGRTPDGWFYCAHAHCVDRTQQDVMRALPPDALRRALTPKQSNSNIR